MKITPENINAIAADLAEEKLAWHLWGQEIWYDAPNGDQYYTERAQDLFDQYYDLFTETLTQEVANA